MPTPRDDDPADAPTLAANAAKVLTGIAADVENAEPPTVAMAQRWHRDLYAGIARPNDDYADEVQVVGNALGVRSELVPQALQRFERGAQTAASRLDTAIDVVADPSAMAPPELHGVLTFCALLHGNWVRIHPFANGNGRTARLWANWAALRYGLPPFVTIKPRPGHPYRAAAAASIAGDDQVMVAAMEQMLRDFLS